MNSQGMRASDPDDHPAGASAPDDHPAGASAPDSLPVRAIAHHRCGLPEVLQLEEDITV